MFFSNSQSFYASNAGPMAVAMDHSGAADSYGRISMSGSSGLTFFPDAGERRPSGPGQSPSRELDGADSPNGSASATTRLEKPRMAEHQRNRPPALATPSGRKGLESVSYPSQPKFRQAVQWKRHRERPGRPIYSRHSEADRERRARRQLRRLRATLG